MNRVVLVAAAFALSMSMAQAQAPAAAVPTTFITVNGDGGARVYDGVGAILGGGGNARYLEDYPARQRASIADYLFKPGTFNGYVFDVNTDGTFTLKLSKGGTAAYTQSGQQQITPPRLTLLAQGKVPFSPGTWHKLWLSVSGTTITARVDSKRLASLSDSTLKRGIPGIEVGGWYPAYFSNLNVTAPN